MNHSCFLNEDIAIVGMAGRFPGAPDVETFWKNVCEGVESIRFFRDEELAASAAERPADDPHFVKARGIVEGADLFDAEFFGMAPREAALTDPQQRLFLECAWEALESAGCDPERHPGPIGVFAGASWNSYLWHNLVSRDDLREQVGTHSLAVSNQGDYLPVRVSYKLNLRGPGVAVQNACATSLTAVCLACQNLLLRQCDVALAGGASVSFPQIRGYRHEEGGILSPDGHCRPFDAQAGGTVASDGVAVVVLKRLGDALAGGDFIYAAIKGFALTNDGAMKMGFAAPAVDGQATAVAMAQAMAGFEPESIGYVEAHGTATALGDPIEVAALTKAFRAGTDKEGFCALGSVKGNIGHLDAAAGVTGLIKAALALHHRKLPPSLNFQSANPRIDFARSPFRVNTRLTEWKAGSTPRRAGVNAFGIGGTNVHVVLEEAPASPQEPSPKLAGPASLASTSLRRIHLLALSAKTPSALDAATARLAEHLARHPDLRLADAAFTLQTGRREFAHRRVLLCRDAEDAIAAVRARADPRVLGGVVETINRPVAFLFPGQGAQQVNMGRELYEQEPLFRALVDQCAELLQSHLGADLRDVLYPEPDRVEEAKRRMARTFFAQPALFVVEYALARLWMSWGVKPDALLGHSLGEYVAACVAGVFSLETALGIIAERAKLTDSLPAGAMLAVGLSEAEVMPLLGDRLSLSAVNAPAICTVSGPPEAIGRLRGELAGGRVTCLTLPVERAFHSPMVDAVLAQFANCVRRCERSAPQIPVISNVSGRPLTPEEAVDPDYWARHMRRTVRFVGGLGELLKEADRVILEVGTCSTLTGLARLHPDIGDSSRAIASGPSSPERQSEAETLLQALGRLWLAGVPIDWNGFQAGRGCHRVPLPTYPFERKRHWIEPARGAIRSRRREEPRLPQSEIRNPEPETDQSSASAAPSDTMIDRLKALFAELSGLELGSVTGATMFLELGLDSLFLAQVANAIERRFGRRVAFHQLMGEFSTFSTLAAHLEGAEPQAKAAVPRERPAAHAAPVAQLPLTDAQKEIWYASQVSDAASCAYNESRLLHLRGALDADALRQALQRLADRHEALRITFTPAGDAQRIHPQLPMDAPLTDLAEQDAAAQQARLEAMERDEAARPFDLVRGPLVRARLARLQAGHHVLFLTAHHAVCDGHSWGVLLGDLARWYSDLCSRQRRESDCDWQIRGPKSGIRNENPLPPAGDCHGTENPLQFGAFVRELERRRRTSECAAAEKWWVKQFADGAPALDLPSDRPRPAAWVLDGGREQAVARAPLRRELKEFSAEQGCTLFATLLAGWMALLYRLGGQEDIVIGVPVAAREVDGGGTLVGHCLDFLPVRVRVCGAAPFAELLAAVKQAFLQACAHRQCAYGRLLQLLNLPREAGRMPLTSVTFNVDRVRAPWHFAGLEAEVLLNRHSRTTFDLSFNITEAGDDLWLDCRYSAALFDAATIQRWLGHFQTLVRHAAANAGESVNALPLLTDKERRQVLVEWNDTRAERRWQGGVHELFAEQVERTPDAAAVVFGGRALSYRELNERANALADRLRRLGVGTDAPVGVCFERSLEMSIAVLATLKAGGAYVPLDPHYPAERLKLMLETSRARVLVTHKRLRDFCAKFESQVSNLEWVSLDETPVASKPQPPRSTLHVATPHSALRAPHSNDLAYILFTSGSTGVPKGVAMPHRALVNLIQWQLENSPPRPGARTLQFASLSFDVSFQEMFCTWCAGGTLVLIDESLRRDAPGLLRFLGEQRVERLFLPFVALQQLAEACDDRTPPPQCLREIVTAGEQLHITPKITALFEKLPQCVLHNQYGPAESHVVTAFRLQGAPREWPQLPPIGRPIANAQIHILDERLQPVPVGVPGELFIGGECLARGYLNRPDLTAERFVPNPFGDGQDARLYKTGDLARWRADGNIEFLGRRDHQVKVRGHRVELGEVEAVLERHVSVKECTVTAHRQADGQVQLAAYVVPAPGGPAPTAGELRRHLEAQLPDHMVPAAFVFLAALPLTPSGKVNRRALPAPLPGAGSESQFVAPRTPAEETLATIWREVLGVPRVSVHDDFFDVGGHSLRLTQVLLRVRDAFDLELPVRVLFEARTIAAQAAVIEERLIAEIRALDDETSQRPAGVPVAAEREAL